MFREDATILVNPSAHPIDAAALQQAGCSWEPEGNFEVMRAPIGSDEWGRQYTRARAEETVEVYAELTRLGDPHAAFI